MFCDVWGASYTADLSAGTGKIRTKHFHKKKKNLKEK